MNQPTRLRWKAARPDLYFLCETCDQWVLEGNPVECPHNQRILSRAPRALYDPAKDAPVEGVTDVLRACGYKYLAADIEGATGHSWKVKG